MKLDFSAGHERILAGGQETHPAAGNGRMTGIQDRRVHRSADWCNGQPLGLALDGRLLVGKYVEKLFLQPRVFLHDLELAAGKGGPQRLQRRHTLAAFFPAALFSRQDIVRDCAHVAPLPYSLKPPPYEGFSRLSATPESGFSRATSTANFPGTGTLADRIYLYEFNNMAGPGVDSGSLRPALQSTGKTPAFTLSWNQGHWLPPR
jgi:hypothetical protein